ncbi:MAG: hypothetical protein LAT51_10400 [Flavobacteriaceae bacterium]|nr:hypothetical protein [Flavobacteriaceae bacterium]
MKLKKLPGSLYKSIQLRLLDHKKVAEIRPKANVVVSLTSIPSRFNIIDITLKSVLT